MLHGGKEDGPLARGQLGHGSLVLLQAGLRDPPIVHEFHALTSSIVIIICSNVFSACYYCNLK